MSKAQWADFTFPALNLWNMPKHNEIVRLINEYYYEHYKHLWEEDQETRSYVNFVVTYKTGPAYKRPQPFGVAYE